MSKTTKIFLRIIPIVLIGIIMIGNVYGINAAPPPTGDANQNVADLTGNIWSTVSIVIQVVAIAAIIFAGLRYMFASADAKADIKKQTVILIVGAVFVFAAVPIAQLVQNIANDLIK